jgi:hypothetical protein
MAPGISYSLVESILRGSKKFSQEYHWCSDSDVPTLVIEAGKDILVPQTNIDFVPSFDHFLYLVLSVDLPYIPFHDRIWY